MDDLEITIQAQKNASDKHVSTIEQEQNNAQCFCDGNCQHRQKLQAAQDATMLLNRHFRDPRLKVTGSLIEINDNENSVLENGKPAKTKHNRPRPPLPVSKQLVDRHDNFANWFEIGNITFDADRTPDHKERARFLTVQPSPADMRAEALQHSHRHKQPLYRPNLDGIHSLLIKTEIRYRHLFARATASQTADSNAGAPRSDAEGSARNDLAKLAPVLDYKEAGDEQDTQASGVAAKGIPSGSHKREFTDRQGSAICIRCLPISGSL